ncbi:MAG: hypothetical protein ACOH1V_13030 [Stenotrophomonas sp.]
MQVGTAPVRFDISRILAFSTAIALHLLALALLLIPLSQVPIRSDAARPTPRWTMPEIVPVTPPPAPVPAQVTPTIPTPTPPALPRVLDTAPLPIFTTEAVISTDTATIAASIPTTTTTTAPGTAGTPLEGVSLPIPQCPGTRLPA